MPGKPTDQEDEYFARLEFERKRKILDEREARTAEDERRRILSVAGGRCPNCGAELIPVPYRGIELDKCSRCEGVWLDVGDQPMTEHRRRGEEVDLPPERRRNDQGVDQVVRVVEAEEHRAGRDVLRVADVDALEAEPEPEPDDEPYGGIETGGGLG